MTAASAGDPEDPKAFLAADDSLKKFAAGDARLVVAAANAARVYDVSPKLQREWPHGRESWVEAAVSGERRRHGIKG